MIVQQVQYQIVIFIKKKKYYLIVNKKKTKKLLKKKKLKKIKLLIQKILTNFFNKLKGKNILIDEKTCSIYFEKILLKKNLK